jgi:hypothetical protein
MLEVAEYIIHESVIFPLSQPRQVWRPRKTMVFDSSLVKVLLEVNSVLDAWLRIYEYRGPLRLLNYRDMSSPPSSTV